MFLSVHAAHALHFGPADVGDDARSSTIPSRQVEAMMGRLNLARVDIFVFEIYKDGHLFFFLNTGDAVADSADQRIECRRCFDGLSVVAGVNQMTKNAGFTVSQRQNKMPKGKAMIELGIIETLKKPSRPSQITQRRDRGRDVLFFFNASLDRRRDGG